MELFTIILRKDTIIYRGISEKNNKDGKWFVYDIESTKQYGNSYKEFKLKKDLKLINLTSNIFQTHYMDQLNIKYSGNNFDGFDLSKFISLLPIGLPNLESQKQIIRHIEHLENEQRKKLNLEILEPMKFINIDKISNEVKLLSDCLYNKSRYSSYAYDTKFVLEIMDLYKDNFEGFTIPIKMPDLLSGGGQFNREIYIDNIMNLEEISIQNGGDIDYTIKPIKRKETIFDLPIERILFLNKIAQKEFYEKTKDLPLRSHEEEPEIFEEKQAPKYNKTRKVKRLTT